MHWTQQSPLSPLRVLIAGSGIMGHCAARALQSDSRIQWLGIIPWELTSICDRTTANQPESKAFTKWAKPIASTLPCPNGINGHAQLLATLKPDLLILATWGEILSQQTLDALPCPVVNIHPSLLPQYRGANPYSACILNHEAHTGLTVHEVTAAIDAGPILVNTSIPIAEGETGGELRSRMANTRMSSLLTEFMDGWFNQTLYPAPQSESLAEDKRAPSLKLWDGELNPYLHTSQELLRKMQAYHPWLPCFTHVYAHRKVFSDQDKLLLVFNNAGQVLPAVEGGAIGELAFKTGSQPSCIIRCTDYRQICIPLESAYWGQLPITPALFNVLLPSLIGPGNACLIQNPNNNSPS